MPGTPTNPSRSSATNMNIIEIFQRRKLRIKCVHTRFPHFKENNVCLFSQLLVPSKQDSTPEISIIGNMEIKNFTFLFS